MGFFLIFLGSYILGHGDAVVTLILQSLTIFIFFDVVPCIYLINDSDLKATFAETKIYFNFLKLFKSERVDPTFYEDEKKNGNQITQENAVENETKDSNLTKSFDWMRKCRYKKIARIWDQYNLYDQMILDANSMLVDVNHFMLLVACESKTFNFIEIKKKIGYLRLLAT